MANVIYDYPSRASLASIAGQSLAERLRSYIQSLKMASRVRRRTDEPVVVKPLRAGGIRPLKDNDFPLIFLCHDGRRFLPSFLAHYRKLGVTRFLCVDDQSSDGSRDFLLAEDDVDVLNPTSAMWLRVEAEFGAKRYSPCMVSSVGISMSMSMNIWSMTTTSTGRYRN